jgi:hypothetical protein
VKLPFVTGHAFALPTVGNEQIETAFAAICLKALAAGGVGNTVPNQKIAWHSGAKS